MERQKLNFENVVRDIQENKILLPDFQRGFVWKEEDKQRKLVASVLAKMPIGSILLLEANNPNEFASKKIGKKCSIDDTEKINQNVQFLLDGQQRVTVLTNVFSNVIFEDGAFNYRDQLVSNKLQCRFFLKIPKCYKDVESEDIFGSSHLEFPLNSPAEEEPKFLTSDVLNYIEVKYFGANEKCVYNPREKTNSTNLKNYCISNDEDEDNYLIPLYLLIDEKGGSSRYLNGIIKGISVDIIDNLIYKVELLDTQMERIEFAKRYLGKEYYDEFLDEIGGSIENKIDIDRYRNALKNQLEAKQDSWMSSMMTFLQSCITGMNMNKIVVENSNRVRAIDIYENLNLGGVSLSVFDLVMARVAKVSTVNFKTRIFNCLKERQVEQKNKISIHDIDSIMPAELVSVYNEFINKYKCYYPAIRTNCISSEEDFAKVFIDVFLDVLSLYCYNPTFDSKNLKVEYIKKDKILSLEPEDIDARCETVCDAINRAMFFFQVRCGVREVKEINYNLMIVIVAYIFIKDDNFKNKKVHDLLEAWYWASVFSGEYDKDQNTRTMEHLRRLLDIIDGNTSNGWLNSLEKRILNERGFSDKSTMLYENIEITNRAPKEFLRRMVCQYLLIKAYETPFETQNKSTQIGRHSVFSDNAKEYELHHIIPLGSAKTILESSKKLRREKENILNSPLNFIYISKEENKIISDKKLEDYIKFFKATSKASLHLNGKLISTTQDDIIEILKGRFEGLQGDIINRIHMLLGQ